MYPGLIKQYKGGGPKKLKRSAINQLVRELGHDPADVVEVRILANTVSVQRLSYDREGNVRMDTFGAVTLDTYHSIEEDEHLDVQAPDGASG